jgi:hypothetical protein
LTLDMKVLQLGIFRKGRPLEGAQERFLGR